MIVVVIEVGVDNFLMAYFGFSCVFDFNAFAPYQNSCLHYHYA